MTRSPTETPRAATILAFHGGGFLGYFSALVAAALQERRGLIGAPGDLRDSFDMICGTSAGAILAAGIARRVPPADIVRLMAARGEKIFPARRWLPTWPGIFGARFRQTQLGSLLDEVLGDTRLGDLDCPLVIPAVNETRGTPMVFRSADPAQKKIRLVDAVLASAAAPLFLPLHRIDGERYTDGGLIANAPALIASADLTRSFGIPPAHQRVISIGTTHSDAGSGVPARRADGWGGLRWIWGGGRLQSLLIEAQQALDEEILAGLGPCGRLRLDARLEGDEGSKVHMVLAGPDARAVLERAARRCVDGITPDERSFLDGCLRRRARVMDWQHRPGMGPQPVLVRRTDPAGQPHGN